MRSVKPRQEVGSLFQQLFKAEKREPLLVLTLLRHEWPDVVGEELAKKTHPLRLTKRVLWIGATDACWAYELQFFKIDLLSSVQGHLGNDAVQDIRFQATPADEFAKPQGSLIPSPTPAPSAPSDTSSPSRLDLKSHDLKSPPPTPAPPPEMPLNAADAIADPALRARFLRTFGRAHGKMKS